MPVYEYHQLPLNVSEQDSEYFGYFEAARDHKLVLKKCLDCGLLRGEPGPACPWCASMRSEWDEVSGRGTIYSYQIVAHSVLPGFREWVPYPIVLVELDEQRGQPDPGDGLRITANLVNEDMLPENEENVAIGKRVRVTFLDTEDGLALPQFILTDEPPEGEPWRYPV